VGLKKQKLNPALTLIKEVLKTVYKAVPGLHLVCCIPFWSNMFTTVKLKLTPTFVIYVINGVRKIYILKK